MAMNDIVTSLGRIAGVSEFPGMSGAWTWSPIPRFKFYLALSDDGSSAFQVNQLEEFDTNLARGVLEFARERNAQLSVRDASLAAIGGFGQRGYLFDAVLVASPEIHRYHAARDNVLNEQVLAVFPGFSCEVSGSETLDEAAFRFKQMLRPALLRRDPVPFLRMRYDNTRTQAGSIGPNRGFTTQDVLLRELILLDGAPGSFVECENVHGDVRRIEHSERWEVVGGDAIVELERNQLENWVAEFLDCPR